MKILFLGDENSLLIDFIKSFDDEVIVWTEKIDDDFLNLHNPDFIVSYGYRHIIRENVLDKYPNKIINFIGNLSSNLFITRIFKSTSRCHLIL